MSAREFMPVTGPWDEPERVEKTPHRATNKRLRKAAQQLAILRRQVQELRATMVGNGQVEPSREFAPVRDPWEDDD